ncbi:hypothetical protein [Arthrobacter sp. H14-L1]|uniref:hypothetical protein n=1 Tax=Arthrobacter sp. H14-L1 TaxID=2996697 RepID=UPI00226F009B|nr:hypothetical protein [Arthrobacter sp. H14-L1]MCY0905368.1 hypothetical protein [Arthrobacter sp. H14-L1]
MPSYIGDTPRHPATDIPNQEPDMIITTTILTRAAGVAAATAGLLFIGLQINHPHVDANFATTTEYAVRESLKVLMAALAFAGITGMYLRQVKQTGVPGLIGYVMFGTGWLALMSIEVVGLSIIPSLAHSAPGYANDVLAVATGGTATGDIGLFPTVNLVTGILYLAGGLVFGIALFRANILTRWAAALLSVGTVATIGTMVLPQVNYRLFAIPVGVALVGLGYSLWREQRTSAAQPGTSPVSSRLDPAGAK